MLAQTASTEPAERAASGLAASQRGIARLGFRVRV